MVQACTSVRSSPAGTSLAGSVVGLSRSEEEGKGGEEAVEAVIVEANREKAGKEQQHQSKWRKRAKMTIVSSRMAVRSCKHLCARGVFSHHLPSMHAASPPLSRQARRRLPPPSRSLSPSSCPLAVLYI